MKPSWGNPYSLKLHSVGEKVAEFGAQVEKQRVLEGSPWMVGRHAVILQEYEGMLKPSDVIFDRMEIWIWIMNLPFRWMNER